MKNTLLFILLLSALFISCSSDDNNDPNNGNQNGKDMIDEKIIGKWKVEYSKTIKPAQFDEAKGEVNYPENATMIEYNGDYTGHIDQTPKTGMFDYTEFKIEINNDNTILVSQAGKNNNTISYKIENSYLKWQTSKDSPTGVIKYRLENGKLILELIKAEGTHLTYYTISKYSKTTE